MQENKKQALKYYIKSLEYDSTNMEAFNIIINHFRIINFFKEETILSCSPLPIVESRSNGNP